MYMWCSTTLHYSENLNESLYKEGLNEHSYVTSNQRGGVVVKRIVINGSGTKKNRYYSVKNCDHLKVRNRNFGHLGKVFVSFHYYSLVFATTFLSDLVITVRIVLI